MPYNVVLTRSGDPSKIGHTCANFHATQECDGNPLVRCLALTQLRMRCHYQVPLELLHDGEEPDVVAASAALLLD